MLGWEKDKFLLQKKWLRLLHLFKYINNLQMKKTLLLFVFAGLFSLANAQADLNSMAGSAMQAMPTGGVGNILGSLAGGIKPDGFLKGWSGLKGDWTKNLGSIKDVAGASKSLGSLFKNIKPSALTDVFKKSQSDWLSKLSGAKSMTDIGSSISSLTNGIKPDKLTKEFNDNKDTFLKGLSLLK